MVQENTTLLNDLVERKTTQKELEDGLNSSQATAVCVSRAYVMIVNLQAAEFSGPQKSDILRKQQLSQLVQHQARQVEALRTEIALLVKKDGLIFRPSVPS